MRGSVCRLHTQLSALRVDEAVLNVAAATNNEGTLVASKAPTNYLSSLTHNSGSQQAGGGDSSSGTHYRAAPLGAAKGSGGGLYPSQWRKQSDQLITEAQQLAVDSSRWGQSALCRMLQLHSRSGLYVEANAAVHAWTLCQYFAHSRHVWLCV